MTLRESHDFAWRAIDSNEWKMAMCCVTASVGPRGEPLACTLKADHTANHSWSSLPTFSLAHGDGPQTVDSNLLNHLKLSVPPDRKGSQ